MFFTELSFGKHKNKILPQVLWVDPDWFFWAYSNGVFKGYVYNQAEYLYNRATKIKIPRDDPENWKIEYIADTRNKFANFSIVEVDRPSHKGSSIPYYKNVIDISFPRQLKGYDKLGCKIFIQQLKSLFFNNIKYRMTKERSIEFFNDDSNFVLGFLFILDSYSYVRILFYIKNFFAKLLIIIILKILYFNINLYEKNKYSFYTSGVNSFYIKCKTFFNFFSKDILTNNISFIFLKQL